MIKDKLFQTPRECNLIQKLFTGRREFTFFLGSALYETPTAEFVFTGGWPAVVFREELL